MGPWPSGSVTHDTIHVLGGLHLGVQALILLLDRLQHLFSLVEQIQHGSQRRQVGLRAASSPLGKRFGLASGDSRYR